MHGDAIFSRDAARRFPGRADDNHVVLAGEAASELVDDRLQTSEVGRVVVRGDADAHAIRAP